VSSSRTQTYGLTEPCSVFPFSSLFRRSGRGDGFHLAVTVWDSNQREGSDSNQLNYVPTAKSNDLR
jgi:hypothetical protein